MDKVSSIFRKILPIYWAFLTYMLLRPGFENHEYSFMFPNADKLLHFGIFGLLAFCAAAAYPKFRFSYLFQVIAIFGLLTEILQDVMGVGRSLELLDLIADLVGATAGYFALHFLRKKYL